MGPALERLMCNFAAYFDLCEDSIVEAESHEEKRYAGPQEMIHVANIASFEWEKSWQVSVRCALKEDMADAIFFVVLPLTDLPETRTATVQLYVLACLPPSIAAI